MNGDINEIYTAIGPELKRDGLDKVFKNLSGVEQEQIFGACSRLHLVNSLQKTKKNLDTWALINTDALQVYLLCTCLDALADKKIGVGARFTNLLCGLPQLLKNQLITSYAIIKEPSENLGMWENFGNEERLNRVIDYLYNLRRNSFTHDAKIVYSALYTTGISGYMCFIPLGIWNYSVYFCYQRKFHSETTVLRLVILGKIRKMLQLKFDQKFVDDYWQNLEHGLFGK